MRVITFIGLITFIISCFLPCFSVRDSSFDYMGYTALFFGWAGVFIREFGIRKGLKKLVISSKIRIFIGENQ